MTTKKMPPTHVNAVVARQRTLQLLNNKISHLSFLKPIAHAFSSHNQAGRLKQTSASEQQPKCSRTHTT